MAGRNAITDVPGLRVGHAQDEKAQTGCTVFLPPEGTVGAVDKSGGAVGTRQTDPLGLMHIVEEVHAVVLSGGSAFGMESATGVARYLEEMGIGFDAAVAKVPIVPTAILFDLGLGASDRRPDADMGYAAAAAATDDRPAEGNVGVGTGATVGKMLGIEGAMKSGVGTASLDLGDGVIVGALMAVNAAGDVVDPETGEIIAGARLPEDQGGGFADARKVLQGMLGLGKLGFGSGENTVIGVVATNAALSKRDCTVVARMAQDGVARTVRPSHMMMDGDALFALATGQAQADVNIIGAFAAEVVAQAVVRAVRQAEGVAGLPAVSDLAE